MKVLFPLLLLFKLAVASDGDSSVHSMSDKDLIIELIEGLQDLECIEALVGKADREEVRRINGVGSCGQGYVEFRLHYYDSLSDAVEVLVITSETTGKMRALVITKKGKAQPCCLRQPGERAMRNDRSISLSGTQPGV